MARSRTGVGYFFWGGGCEIDVITKEKLRDFSAWGLCGLLSRRSHHARVGDRNRAVVLDAPKEVPKPAEAPKTPTDAPKIGVLAVWSVWRMDRSP